MQNEIYFSSEYFKQKAMNAGTITDTTLTPVDAFFLLIEKIDIKDLDLFCENIKEDTQLPLSIEEIYNLLQNSEKMTIEQKNEIFKIALNTKTFGSHIIDVGNKMQINTSSWINHSLNVGIAASNLASTLENSNKNTAFVLGLLHDIGRKFKTDMRHTVAGYEYLIEKGYNNEAIICLTHSHLFGERCANNEPAVPGWQCINGKSCWDESIPTDDLTEFLKHITYTLYDHILNIADLIATDHGIVPIHERLQDIASRRKIDVTNRKFFYAKLINLLTCYIHKINPEETYIEIEATDDISLEYLEQILIKTSHSFHEYYKNLSKKENISAKKI